MRYLRHADKLRNSDFARNSIAFRAPHFARLTISPPISRDRTSMPILATEFCNVFCTEFRTISTERIFFSRFAKYSQNFAKYFSENFSENILGNSTAIARICIGFSLTICKDLTRSNAFFRRNGFAKYSHGNRMPISRTDSNAISRTDRIAIRVRISPPISQRILENRTHFASDPIGLTISPKIFLRILQNISHEFSENILGNSGIRQRSNAFRTDSIGFVRIRSNAFRTDSIGFSLTICKRFSRIRQRSNAFRTDSIGFSLTICKIFSENILGDSATIGRFSRTDSIGLSLTICKIFLTNSPKIFSGIRQRSNAFRQRSNAFRTDSIGFSLPICKIFSGIRARIRSDSRFLRKYSREFGSDRMHFGSDSLTDSIGFSHDFSGNISHDLQNIFRDFSPKIFSEFRTVRMHFARIECDSLTDRMRFSLTISPEIFLTICKIFSEIFLRKYSQNFARFECISHGSNAFRTDRMRFSHGSNAILSHDFSGNISHDLQKYFQRFFSENILRISYDFECDSHGFSHDLQNILRNSAAIECDSLTICKIFSEFLRKYFSRFAKYFQRFFSENILRISLAFRTISLAFCTDRMRFERISVPISLAFRTISVPISLSRFAKYSQNFTNRMDRLHFARFRCRSYGFRPDLIGDFLAMGLRSFQILWQRFFRVATIATRKSLSRVVQNYLRPADKLRNSDAGFDRIPCTHFARLTICNDLSRSDAFFLATICKIFSEFRTISIGFSLTICKIFSEFCKIFLTISLKIFSGIRRRSHGSDRILSRDLQRSLAIGCVLSRNDLQNIPRESDAFRARIRSGFATISRDRVPQRSAKYSRESYAFRTDPIGLTISLKIFSEFCKIFLTNSPKIFSGIREFGSDRMHFARIRSDSYGFGRTHFARIRSDSLSRFAKDSREFGNDRTRFARIRSDSLSRFAKYSPKIFSGIRQRSDAFRARIRSDSLSRFAKYFSRILRKYSRGFGNDRTHFGNDRMHFARIRSDSLSRFAKYSRGFAHGFDRTHDFSGNILGNSAAIECISAAILSRIRSDSLTISPEIFLTICKIFSEIFLRKYSQNFAQFECISHGSNAILSRIECDSLSRFLRKYFSRFAKYFQRFFSENILRISHGSNAFRTDRMHFARIECDSLTDRMRFSLTISPEIFLTICKNIFRDFSPKIFSEFRCDFARNSNAFRTDSRCTISHRIRTRFARISMQRLRIRFFLTICKIFSEFRCVSHGFRTLFVRISMPISLAFRTLFARDSLTISPKIILRISAKYFQRRFLSKIFCTDFGCVFVRNSMPISLAFRCVFARNSNAFRTDSLTISPKIFSGFRCVLHGFRLRFRTEFERFSHGFSHDSPKIFSGFR